VVGFEELGERAKGCYENDGGVAWKRWSGGWGGAREVGGEERGGGVGEVEG